MYCLIYSHIIRVVVRRNDIVCKLTKYRYINQYSAYKCTLERVIVLLLCPT
nr:MAG TPA: hypothetical protein [Caudoviricetes sp.]